ncbi:unnamed protein product [Ectocarpus sp. 12 AP-2014]
MLKLDAPSFDKPLLTTNEQRAPPNPTPPHPATPHRTAPHATERHSATHQRMVFLVKTCKTFHLTKKINWVDISTRVEGVRNIDERRTIMVFRRAGTHPSETVILGSKHSPVVTTCCTYHGGNVGGDDGSDVTSVRALLEQSAFIVGIRSSSCSYNVFRLESLEFVDIFKTEYLLSRRGFPTVLEHEVASGLVFTDGADSEITWSISDSVPQKILVSVTGNVPSKAHDMVEESRSKVGLP